MDKMDERFGLLEEKILSETGIKDTSRIRAAYEYARSSHGDQLRKSGEPYIVHPIATAENIVEMGLDEESIIAGLLHDCIEDTGSTYEEIAARFSPAVADLVAGVTKLTRTVYTSKEEEQMENLRKMLLAMTKDIRVILIKMADRLHNMRTMEYQSDRKQKEKALETMEIYAPIAHRLGMQKVKWELEDLSLLYLDPVGYAEIEKGIAQHESQHSDFAETIQSAVTQRLGQVGIACDVYGRVKHIYSIYRKMYSQNKEFSEVLDLYAFRVIVDTIADCYNVLGYIHEMYKPLPGRFKDYIGTPKPNMYQSLHTTVIGSEGVPFEVQIRTWDMHHMAEYGVAAHWKYKQGVSGGKQSDEEKYAWIRNLLESQQVSDAQDFFRNIKTSLFDDEVFVFTPKGDVVSLPAKATPIDFAYSIHSAIGNKMSGAIVNGRIVPFNYMLQNGDIVEVQTSNASRGPSRDWMNLVVSSEARNKIRQWFKKEKREENILHGKASFEAELRRAGITMAEITQDEVLPQLLRKVSFPALEEMYAAIGYGGVTAQKMVNRIRDEMRQMEKTGARPDKTITIGSENQKPRKAVRGIIVEGIDNCLVKFARCCTPVPGDAVIGYITRGYGVSVHRTDCQNYKYSINDPEEAGRWINVTWADKCEEGYETSINVVARERSGLVLDIATVLGGLKVKVNTLNGRDQGDGVATVFLGLEVKNSQELMLVMNKLNAISGVTEVRRTGN